MRSRRAREPSKIPLLVFLRGLNNKNGMLKKFVFKKISTIEIPKIINLNKMAIPKKAYLLSFSQDNETKMVMKSW